jgi:ribosomal protein S18 acetylase RimI-like enzyme
MKRQNLLNESYGNIAIRPATADDLHDVIELDARVTLIKKENYWQETFERFIGTLGRHFWVAEMKNKNQSLFVGFIVGEIRAWEFGSQPCGWVLTILVRSEFQGRGIGEQLFEVICESMKKDGVLTVRTMIAREDTLNMSFFRSQGMMAGPFIELEMPLNQFSKRV